MSKKFDFKYFEYILLFNALTNSIYLSSIIDYYLDYFCENRSVRRIMRLLIDFYNKRQTLPTVTELKLQLTTDDDKEAFSDVLRVFKGLDKKFHPDELIENTEKFFREKSIYKGILDVSSKINSDTEEVHPDQVLDYFQKACSISLIDNLGMDYLEMIDAHCKELERPDEFISTGWKWLDNKLGGGFQKHGRALYVFSGFANAGKSVFLANVSTNILKQNLPVVIFSLEMSESMYAKRISSNLSKIPIHDLKTNVDDLKASIYKFREDLPNAKLIIKEYPPKSATAHTISAFLKKLAQKGIKPSLIVIDYLTLMKSTKKENGMYEEGKSISEQVRALSYSFECPILSATQLNRSGAKAENPGMEKTSESIGVSFTVDAQFNIWSSDEDRACGLINMGIIKNRFGENFGTTRLRVDYPTLTLEEIENMVSMSLDESSSEADKTMEKFSNFT